MSLNTIISLHRYYSIKIDDGKATKVGCYGYSGAYLSKTPIRYLNSYVLMLMVDGLGYRVGRWWGVPLEGDSPKTVILSFPVQSMLSLCSLAHI